MYIACYDFRMFVKSLVIFNNLMRERDLSEKYKDNRVYTLQCLEICIRRFYAAFVLLSRETRVRRNLSELKHPARDSEQRWQDGENFTGNAAQGCFVSSDPFSVT